MFNETAAAATPVAAWSADVYAKRAVTRADVLLGPLARGCVTLLCGPRGVGKSWLALALAHTAARGGSLAKWRAGRPHRVVFVDAAGSEAVLRDRLVALGPKPPPALVLVPGDAQANGLPDLSLESGRKALDELVTDADLVVIDGVSALVRKGRGVGSRWAALEDWLRALRRRHMAVLLVDSKEPRPLADLADTVLKVEAPADGVREGDLRLQVRLLSSRPRLGPERFELRLVLRQDGAAWARIDDLDHRALIAYRLDRQDYSSRAIAKLLGVSPATGWRLVLRGSRLPQHIRDRVDLDVPIPPRAQNRDWAKILRLAGITAAAESHTLPPIGGKEGPARVSVREDEGENTTSAAPAAHTARGALRAPPHLDPPPVGRRTSEGASAPAAPAPQTLQPAEAVKRRERAQRLWRTPLHQLMKERGLG